MLDYEGFAPITTQDLDLLAIESYATSLARLPLLVTRFFPPHPSLNFPHFPTNSNSSSPSNHFSRLNRLISSSSDTSLAPSLTAGLRFRKLQESAGYEHRSWISLDSKDLEGQCHHREGGEMNLIAHIRMRGTEVRRRIVEEGERGIFLRFPRSRFRSYFFRLYFQYP